VNEQKLIKTVKSLIYLHVTTCGHCIRAMNEMEAYVAASGDWPEGTHGLVEQQLRALNKIMAELGSQLELPF